MSAADTGAPDFEGHATEAEAAAADVVRLDDAGGFELDARCGNVALRFELEGTLADVPQQLATLFDPVGGWVEGWAEGASCALVVCTVPVQAGFPAIEEAAGRALVETGAIRWTYGTARGRGGGR